MTAPSFRIAPGSIVLHFVVGTDGVIKSYPGPPPGVFKNLLTGEQRLARDSDYLTEEGKRHYGFLNESIAEVNAYALEPDMDAVYPENVTLNEGWLADNDDDWPDRESWWRRSIDWWSRHWNGDV